MLKSVRLVWNLTTACPYHCEFCATAANSHPSPLVDKTQILRSIASINLPISIDFSGGDPLYQTSDIEIIQLAGQIFGKENFEISTTGLSLSKLDDYTITSLANSYSFTYDWPKDICSSPRAEFCRQNYEQILRLRQLQIAFEVALIIRKLPTDIVKHLVDDLIALQPERIALLQMMPLGYSSGQKVQYLRSETNQLISLLRAGGFQGKITTSCAYRGECNGMSNRKFGIDETGNLFGCIWAADLDLPLSKNRFYLGNLLDESLSDIISRNFTKIVELPRHFCYVLEQSTQPVIS